MELTETGLPKSYKEKMLKKDYIEAGKRAKDYERRLKHFKGDDFYLNLVRMMNERYQDKKQKYLDFKMQN